MADVNNAKNFKKYPFFKGGGQLFCANGSSKLKECFDLFDANSDGLLDELEFECLLKNLFIKEDDSNQINSTLSKDIYKLLNEKQGKGIDIEVFTVFWHKWIKQVVDPVSAFLVIDVQNDFIDGSLAVRNCPAKHEGADCIPAINTMLDKAKFDVVVYSCDWHPKDHISFVDNVKKREMHHTSKVKADKAATYDTVVFSSPRIMEQRLWPAHCVQNTKGAELHPDLKIAKNHIRINKGTNPDIDSYSAFWDNQRLAETALISELKQRGVTDVYICGIAYDVCVGWTALDALDHGLRTIVVDDASRGLDEDEIEKMRQNLRSKGAIIVNSEEVPALVSGLDRRPELGKFAASVVVEKRKSANEEKQKGCEKKS